MSSPSSDATLGRMLLTFLVLALLSAGVAVGRGYSSADTAVVEASSPAVPAPVTTAAAVVETDGSMKTVSTRWVESC